MEMCECVKMGVGGKVGRWEVGKVREGWKVGKRKKGKRWEKWKGEDGKMEGGRWNG